MVTHFDDFLNLQRAELASQRLIVFTGCSGSGKSTAMSFLAQRHQCFRDRQSVTWLHLDTRPRLPADQGLVLVDEVTQLRQLNLVRSLLGNGNGTVVVASHLPAVVWSVFKPFIRTRLFATDQQPEKIARYLSRCNVEHSAAAVRIFCRQYGASFLDVDCILERHPGRSFDEALQLVQKFDRIDHQPNVL